MSQTDPDHRHYDLVDVQGLTDYLLRNVANATKNKWFSMIQTTCLALTCLDKSEERVEAMGQSKHLSVMIQISTIDSFDEQTCPKQRCSETVPQCTTVEYMKEYIFRQRL